MDFLMKT